MPASVRGSAHKTTADCARGGISFIGFLQWTSLPPFVPACASTPAPWPRRSSTRSASARAQMPPRCATSGSAPARRSGASSRAWTDRPRRRTWRSSSRTGARSRPPPAAPGALAPAARAADWPLPARVRVAVAALPVEPAGDVALAGPARVVSGTVDGGRGALVVADDGEAERRLRRAASALGLEPPLALGPAVPPAEAARSAARAAALLAQVHAGTIASAELLRCDDHEVELLLVADPDLARAVARRR